MNIYVFHGLGTTAQWLQPRQQLIDPRAHGRWRAGARSYADMLHVQLLLDIGTTAYAAKTFFGRATYSAFIGATATT